MPKKNVLSAGADLDILVATKVMGWKRGLQWGNGNGEWIIDGKGYDVHHISWDTTPPFSTSIGIVWRVVERLEIIPIGLSSCSGDSWRLIKTFHGGIRFDMMTPSGIVEGPEADTIPFAICLAALKDVEKTSDA